MSTVSLDDRRLPGQPLQGAARHRADKDGATRAPAAHEVHFQNEEELEGKAFDLLETDEGSLRETFLPITRAALVDRLTRPQAWPPGQARDARQFFKYLTYWRQQQHNAAAVDLDQTYELFNPDSDLLMTRQFTERERRDMQARVVRGTRRLLRQANYRRLDPNEIELILTKESHYGLSLIHISEPTRLDARSRMPSSA